MNVLFFTGVNFFVKGFNILTFMLDKGIYSLAKVAYAVFYYLSNATILSDNIVRNVTVRMYTILSIIMVFVLAYNLLNYIIDPDKINDKKIGASAFVKDVIIALVIISMTPMLFTKLYSFQSKVITSGVLSNIILGGKDTDYESSVTYVDYEKNKSNYNSITDYYVQNGANSMIASIYVAFLYPQNGTTALDCGGEGNVPPDMYCEAYYAVKSSGDIAPFGDFINNDNDYNFTPLMTTAAGCVLLYFMFIFCISLGKRVGKLAIIQLVAPIPVTLELLPNKKGLRKNWIDTLIKVYLEVFIYMLVMYLIIFLISLIPDTVSRLFANATTGGFSLVKVVTVIILIFGLLLFAKDAPKMLMDLLGIKSAGLITGAIKDGKVGAGWAALLGGTAGSMLGNAIRNFNSTEFDKDHPIKTGWTKATSAIGGASSTLFRNAWGARNVHSIKDANNLRRTVNRNVVQARDRRDAYAASHGGNLRGAMKGHVVDMWTDVKDTTKSYIYGKDTSFDSQLSMLDRLSSATSAAKIDVDKDPKYTEYRSRYNNLRTSEFINDFEAWKSLYNPSGTEKDYINWMKTDTTGMGSLDRQRYNSLIDAHDSMNARENEMKTRNEGKLRIAAQEAKAILTQYPQLSDLKDDKGGVLIDRLKGCVDDSGQLVSGKTAIDLQSVINDYNKAINKKKTDIQVANAEKRIREEQRKNRQSGSSGDKK